MKTRKIDKDKMNHLFKEATLEAASIKGKQLIEEVENDSYLPSFQFSQRIQQVIQTETSRSQPFRFFKQLYLGFSKASVWILLALIVLLVTVSNVAAARDWVSKLIIDANPKFVTYYLQPKEQATDPSNEDMARTILPIGVYFPSYLPEGMRLVQFEYTQTELLYQYLDDSGNFIEIQILGAGATVNLDNENLEEQSLETVDGIEATYTKKLGHSLLIWSDEDNIFIVRTTLSKEETLQIARGLLKNK